MKHDAVRDALGIAAAHFGVSARDIRSQRRNRFVHPARLWGVYLACKTTDATPAQIGKLCGGRCEATIRMYARACAHMVSTDKEASALFEQLSVARALTKEPRPEHSRR